ncbi:asparagine synthase-related protein, partial [Priestia sp. BR_2]
IEVIIRAYEQEGLECLKGLNGKYIILLIDKKNNEWIISNDRYGFGTCYFYKQEETYAFCNAMHPLISLIKQVRINRDSMNDFFNFGYLLGNKTMIQNIEKLEPASIIKINKDGWHFEKYWEWNDIKKKEPRNYNEAVRRLGELWIASVRKIVNKHNSFCIPLSGGLDSRAIVAAIDYLEMNDKIKLTYTFGKKGSLDYKIAKQVSEILGVEHQLIELDATYWWRNIRKAVRNSTGAVSVIHSHAIASQETGLKNV